MDEITNYFTSRQTSGFVEDNKVKILRRRCYEISSLTRLFQRPFLDFGDYRLFGLWSAGCGACFLSCWRPVFHDLFPCSPGCPDSQPFKLSQWKIFFGGKEQEQDQYWLWKIPAVRFFAKVEKLL
jgi:hypothetical protein